MIKVTILAHSLKGFSSVFFDVDGVGNDKNIASILLLVLGRKAVVLVGTATSSKFGVGNIAWGTPERLLSS